MKYSIILLIVLGLCTTGVQAQTSSRSYVMKVGPVVGLVGAGINTENATGRKVNPDFMGMPYLGAAIYAPFGIDTRMGLRLDIAYSSVSSLVRPYEMYAGGSNWSKSFQERYNYVTIAPMINLAGFLIGMGINIPASGIMKNDAGTEFEVRTADMKTAVDVRLGGQITVWSSDIGTLTVDILAKYGFNGVYNDNSYTIGSAVEHIGFPADNVTSKTITGMVPGSLTLGLSYLFDLKF
ncbi:MAG: hypothetical protein JSS89_09985 [Bacteroidetes bacterium]|nr:hypothetical protein [Bacteroidota bacterium]